jgi:hypothetical protein
VLWRGHHANSPRPTACANDYSPRVFPDELRGLLREALAEVITDEWGLLEVAAGERAIVHQLALRVRTRIACLGDYDVDVEYNRQALRGSPKRLNGGLAVPDLVVHRRGLHGLGDNLLVVEAKKAWPDEAAPGPDVDKLRSAVVDLRYRYAVAMEVTGAAGRDGPLWWWAASAKVANGLDDVEPIFEAAEFARLRNRGRTAWCAKLASRRGPGARPAAAQRDPTQ